MFSSLLSSLPPSPSFPFSTPSNLVKLFSTRDKRPCTSWLSRAYPGWAEEEGCEPQRMKDWHADGGLVLFTVLFRLVVFYNVDRQTEKKLIKRR